MKQGSKETIVYYTIKVGKSFVKEIAGGDMVDEKFSLAVTLSLSAYESDALKWKFDSLSENSSTENRYLIEQDFVRVLKILDKNGVNYKVLKNTIATTEDQKEVCFLDGKEFERPQLFIEGDTALGNNGFFRMSKALDNSPREFKINIENFKGNSSEKDELYDTIYNVCKQVIKDREEGHNLAKLLKEDLNKRGLI